MFNNKIVDWTLQFSFHWPHYRCALGWEYIAATEKDNYDTYTFFIVIATLQFDVYYK